MNQVLKKYDKGQLGLENVLRKQRYSIDKYGFGYPKFVKPGSSKTMLKLAINSIMWKQGKCKLKFILRGPMLKIILMSLKIKKKI